MPDAPAGGKRIGKVWVILTAWAVFAIAIGLYIFLSPQQVGTRSRIVRLARSLGRLVGLEDRPRKPIAVIIGDIDRGDEARKAQAIFLSSELTDAELAQVFPHLLRAMKDELDGVRNAAATVVGDLSPRLSREAPVVEAALTALLDDPSPALRPGRRDPWGPSPRAVGSTPRHLDWSRASTTKRNSSASARSKPWSSIGRDPKRSSPWRCDACRPKPR